MTRRTWITDLIALKPTEEKPLTFICEDGVERTFTSTNQILKCFRELEPGYIFKSICEEGIITIKSTVL